MSLKGSNSTPLVRKGLKQYETGSELVHIPLQLKFKYCDITIVAETLFSTEYLISNYA